MLDSSPNRGIVLRNEARSCRDVGRPWPRSSARSIDSDRSVVSSHEQSGSGQVSQSFEFSLANARGYDRRCDGDPEHGRIRHPGGVVMACQWMTAPFLLVLLPVALTAAEPSWEG